MRNNILHITLQLQCAVSYGSEIITLVWSTMLTTEAQVGMEQKTNDGVANISLEVNGMDCDLEGRRYEKMDIEIKKVTKMIKYRRFMAVLYESTGTNIFSLVSVLRYIQFTSAQPPPPSHLHSFLPSQTRSFPGIYFTVSVLL